MFDNHSVQQVYRVELYELTQIKAFNIGRNLQLDTFKREEFTYIITATNVGPNEAQANDTQAIIYKMD